MEKYFIRGNGERIPLSTMNTEHIIHALDKKVREVFTTTTSDEFYGKISEINDLKEELYKRFNEYGERTGVANGGN